MGSVLEEKSQERPTPPSASGPPLWVRPAASRDNLVVITAEELIVATVARDKLTEVVEALESGVPSHELLGNDTRIPLFSIVSLSAPLNTTGMIVEFEEKRRKFGTRRFAVHDAEAQAEILEEVAQRIGSRAAFVRSVPNRMLRVMKPFNLLMAIAVIAGGFDYLAVHTFNIDAKGVPQNLPTGREKPQQRLVRFRKLAAGLPKVRLVPFAGIAVMISVVVTGFLLLTIGYHATLVAFMIAAGLSVFWVLRRLLFLPVTVSVVNERFAVGD